MTFVSRPNERLASAVRWRRRMGETVPDNPEAVRIEMMLTPSVMKNGMVRWTRHQDKLMDAIAAGIDPNNVPVVVFGELESGRRLDRANHRMYLGKLKTHRLSSPGTTVVLSRRGNRLYLDLRTPAGQPVA